MEYAGGRAAAAWENREVPWANRRVWLAAHSTILERYAADAGSDWDPRFFDDVLSPRQVASLRIGPRYERYPAPPPLAEASPLFLKFLDDPELLAAAMRHDLAREHVVELIDRIPSDAVYSVPLLRRAYARDDPRTIAACVQAIERTSLDGEPERAFFARADADDATGLLFARVFDQQGREDGLATLLQLAKSKADAEVRTAALQAVGSRPRAADVQKELLAMLTEENETPLIVEIAAAEAVLQLLPADHPARPQTARLLYLRQLQWTSEVLTDTISQQRHARKQTERESLESLGLGDLLD
jgi:hypothetical protein